MNIENEYLATVIRRVKYYRDVGEKACVQLGDDDFYWSPSPESNSIEVIIQHLSQNMLSRWTNFLTEDGEKNWRNRDDEFEIHHYSRQQLMDMWTKGWDCYIGALTLLTAADLLKTIYIRKEQMTAIDALNRQLAHYAYHIGQIVYVGRLIKKDNWKSLSIPKGGSREYNEGDHIKDPAKRF